ncbi:toll-like receptor 2 [Sphaeramia orbicularis]|uniref:toll-like receptor 2 n=1 Tax=Sphaeramia orbicularis TaxID=375764 RepID=UPI00117D8D4B|nr:toll-like receptor 2 [Sphaeramia orbicularis]
MASLVVLVFVHLLTCEVLSVSRPRCDRCDQTSCNCSWKQLQQVPTTTSKLTTVLNLSFNWITSILHDDFLGYSSLRSLIISNNRINMIDREAFSPLKNLENLDLSENDLDTLSAEWFRHLPSLQSLNILGNRYQSLSQDSLFQPLKNLKKLHFGGPLLQSVRKGDFSGLGCLEELVFDGRNLQKYDKGSLRVIEAISHATLGLNDPFQKNLQLVEDILSDAVQPNTTLTFTDTELFKNYQMSPVELAFNRGIRTFSFNNCNLSVEVCFKLLDLMSDSEISTFMIEDTKVMLLSETQLVIPNNQKHLEVVSFKNVEVTPFHVFPALIFLQPSLNKLRRISVLDSKVFAIPCGTADFISLEYLDLSQNMLFDLTFKEMMCDGDGGVFLNLKTINISKNHLETIDSELFTGLRKLENIDMSGNSFNDMPDTCQWPPALRYLNLSSAHLTQVTSCLPESLQILDLSNNSLTVFNLKMPSLTDLYISGNKIGSFPHGGLFPHLTFMSIQNNGLQTFSHDSLDEYKMLDILEAGANTYVCSCDFVAFMNNDLTNRVKIRDEFKSYICESPDAVRGEVVTEVRLSVFECHTALAFSLLCFSILVVVLVIVGLCYKFNVVWYMTMTWAWIRAKRRPVITKGELKYDAFVSYSEMDAGWVEAHLIPELEESEPPLSLCLHKRDFAPGGWILDNIMEAIEQSHKTVFILSQHFIKSEWCKYELDYTHFRMLDHNDDTVVLVLLEPIDKNTIPKRFCKLRKVMNSRTYLEWPDDDNHIPRFWQSLRAAIAKPMTVC